MEILLRVCEKAESLYHLIEEEEEKRFPGMAPLDEVSIFNEALTIGFTQILEDIQQKKCGAYDLNLRKVTPQEREGIYHHAMKRSHEIVNGRLEKGK